MEAFATNRVSILSSPDLASQVLAKSQADREVVQDYCPLAESLEWQLGQMYFRTRGNKAFLSDAIPIPFIINNDGTLSRNAADLFFVNCLADEKAGRLEDAIFILEIGIGVGLFARFFLDRIRELCRQNDKDYYDRLCYVATDKSERMLMDFLKLGLMANHPGRYRVRTIDALEPDGLLPNDVMFNNHRDRPFRAVFLNYLLDCLPAAVLDVSGADVKELCVRTCVARNVGLRDHTDMSLKSIQERANSKNSRVRDELMEIYGFFASEYDYRAANLDRIPYGRFAVEFGRGHGKRIMHNFGAIQCLDRLLSIVSTRGFILMNEYGHTRSDHDYQHEHQRFSFATAVGLNFPLLKAFFSRRHHWVEPPQGEERGIETRLLGHQPSHDTIVRFHELFQPASFTRLEEPIKKARACLESGRFEMAAGFYREALRLQPQNWVLIGEVSNFMTFQMQDPKAGADMAKVALKLNPVCSAELWNALGDALYAFGRDSEARSAYEKAITVNSSDVRARFGLAWVHTRQKRYDKALSVIADALAMDKSGKYREALLQKQTEILAHLAQKHQREYLLHVNLVSHDSQSIRWENDKKKRDEAGIIFPN